MAVAQRSRWFALTLMVIGELCLTVGRARAAEHIRIGMVRTASPVLIAIDRQYWSAEGLDPELVFFDSAPPVAVAVASGDLDFGVTGLSGGLYNLGNTLRIIAASTREAPGFQLSAYLAAKGAYDKGLKTLPDFPGHSVAITQFGAPVHYDLELLIQKYRFDAKSIRIVPLPSNPAQIAALTGGTVDAAIVPVSYALQALDRGDIKLLGYVGDETPWQNGAAFTSAKVADHRGATIDAFLRGYRKATRDYHDAFTSEDERRADSLTAPAVIAILAKHLNQPPALVASGVQYVDPEARLDVEDVIRQIAWYHAQGLLKAEIDPAVLIDKRYVRALPKS
jgi:NitT/TauT family transport system substrate-binding protein